MIKKGIREDRLWNYRGSFTVEAACLLPLIVFLIWNILYLSFFLYDQSTIVQGNYCTALRTERLIGTAEEKAVEAEKKYDLCVKKKIVCGTVRDRKTIEQERVTVETRIDMYAPAETFFESLWHGENKQTAERWQPVTFIRNCRKAEDIWNTLQTENG